MVSVRSETAVLDHSLCRSLIASSPACGAPEAGGLHERLMVAPSDVSPSSFIDSDGINNASVILPVKPTATPQIAIIDASSMPSDVPSSVTKLEGDRHAARTAPPASDDMEPSRGHRGADRSGHPHDPEPQPFVKSHTRGPGADQGTGDASGIGASRSPLTNRGAAAGSADAEQAPLAPAGSADARRSPLNSAGADNLPCSTYHCLDRLWCIQRGICKREGYDAPSDRTAPAGSAAGGADGS